MAGLQVALYTEGKRALAPWHVVPADQKYPRDLLVAEVVSNSAAETAGLMVGDVLLAIDGAPSRTGDELLRALGSHRPGEPRRLTFLRGGRRREVTVVPHAREAAW